MITLEQLMYTIRLGLQDQLKIRYSDYEIIDTINSVLRNINNSLVRIGSNYIKKKGKLLLSDGQSELPDDFIRINSVTHNDEEISYSILNNQIYADTDVLDIEYTYQFEDIDSSSYELPLPNFFLELVSNYVCMILDKQISKYAFFEPILRDVESIVTGREYTYIPREMPFII